MKNIFIIISFIFSTMIYGQYGEIKGVVSDDLGPIEDITVKVKGANTGTVTDFDGLFSLKVNIGDTLIFSHVSYKTQEITVANFNKLKITMNFYGYYVMTIYEKEPKYFSKLSLCTDLKNESNGVLASLYLSEFSKKIKPELIYGFQKGKNISKIISEVRLPNLIKIFSKRIDLNLIYNEIVSDNFAIKKQLLETQFGQRIFRKYFDIYLGFGNITFNDVNNNAFEIGVKKRFLRLFNVYSKTIFFENKWQFQNGLNIYYKKFNLQIEHSHFKKFNEFNMSIGYLIKF